MKKEDKSIDKASQELLEIAEKEGIDTAWDRYEAMVPQCGFGELGLCCRNCLLGPCRIDPFEEGPQKGVCGATAEIIAARNLIRMIAAGASAHSDHGRDIAHTLLLTAQGKTKGYGVKDEQKLLSLAGELGIKTNGRDKKEIAKEVAEKVFSEFGQQHGELQFSHRAPEKRQALWRKLGIMPRGIDREIVEVMHRTTMGVDNDCENLITHGMRTALGDGWGGSMIATELSDVLFGTPRPIRAKVNLGVLKEDEVNLVVHGHEPTLSDVIVTASQDKELIELAKKNGAKGINLAGICCTANEILMRYGIPIAGNFLQQELAIATGAVDLMLVDVQCIMPALSSVAKCFHTKLISTSPKAKFPGAEHVEFNEEESLPQVLRQVPPGAVDEIIVVDNGSTDQTASVARGAGARVIMEPRKGYGAACWAGFQATTADVLVFMDADGSFLPHEISNLVVPIACGKAELVLGSRTLRTDDAKAIPFHARLGNRLIAHAISWASGVCITDLGPFRAVTRNALKNLRMEERTYGWPCEMIIKASRLGSPIIEVPVSYRPRTGGESKVSGTLMGSVKAALAILRVTLRGLFWLPQAK